MTTLFVEAEDFIRNCYGELNKSEMDISRRLTSIQNSIQLTGTYEHTTEELTYGAKMAWRNSNKCIGRLFWDTLQVTDHRHLLTIEEIKYSLFNHINKATNGGKIKPAITIFHPDRVKIWNHQLIKYAGYDTPEGIVGDPDSLKLTQVCQKLGWTGKLGKFDQLPLVIQLDQKEPILFDIPPEMIKEVHLQHPEYDWFKELNLKWYAVPIISNMALEIGGITYQAAPFNGWYMGTEIGARNLADEGRYNMLPIIAEKMGLDVLTNSSLWKDRALVELNVAVLHSYKESGVSIVDHHTAAHQFKLFEKREMEANREVTGNWTWLIPPLSPATTHIFHKQYPNKKLKPRFHYQNDPFTSKLDTSTFD